MVLPDHIRTSIGQRQRQRQRCAQTSAVLLDDHRLAPMAGHIIAQAITLLGEDKADLNGSHSVRAAATIEEDAWKALQQIASTAGIGATGDLRRAHEHIETIKRAIEAQATLIDLAIPDEPPALQDLWTQYQQRYGGND